VGCSSILFVLDFFWKDHHWDWRVDIWETHVSTIYCVLLNKVWAIVGFFFQYRITSTVKKSWWVKQSNICSWCKPRVHCIHSVQANLWAFLNYDPSFFFSQKFKFPSGIVESWICKMKRAYVERHFFLS
jgi:hypothetical protein